MVGTSTELLGRTTSLSIPKNLGTSLSLTLKKIWARELSKSSKRRLEFSQQQMLPGLNVATMS